MDNIHTESPLVVVNSVTGEVKATNVCGYVTTAQREAQRAFVEKQRAKREKLANIPPERRMYYPSGSFLRFRYKPMMPLDTLGLDDMDYTRFVVLCSYMNYRGELMKLNNTPMKTPSDIQKVFQTGYLTTRNFIKNTESLGLLKFEDEKFKINRKACYKGAYKSCKWEAQEVRIFIDALRKVYQNGLEGANKKNLFYILQMIPYMNLKRNVLCKNIYVEQEDLIDVLTFGEFCDIIGTNRERAYRVRQRLSYSNINGMGVLAFDGGVKADTNSVTISPAFICGTSNAEDAQRLLLDKFYKEVT